jgi:hypothetical protein
MVSWLCNLRQAQGLLFCTLEHDELRKNVASSQLRLEAHRDSPSNGKNVASSAMLPLIVVITMSEVIGTVSTEPGVEPSIFGVAIQKHFDLNAVLA